MTYPKPSNGKIEFSERAYNSLIKRVREDTLSDIRNRINKIPVRHIQMQVAHKYPGYAGSKEFVPKKIVMKILEPPSDE